jgi:hypothetical protein
MPYRNLCNGVQREGAELSPTLTPELFCCVHYTKFGMAQCIAAIHTTLVFCFLLLEGQLDAAISRKSSINRYHHSGNES